MLFRKNDVLENHMLKQARLPFSIGIVHHATPASKKHSNDMDGLVFIATEGKDDITAIEDISGMTSYASPADNSTGDSIFQVLVKDLGTIDKVYNVSVVDLGGTATSVAVTLLGASNGLTTNGNIAMQIAGTGLDLSAEDASLALIIEYKVLKS